MDSYFRRCPFFKQCYQFFKDQFDRQSKIKLIKATILSVFTFLYYEKVLVLCEKSHLEFSSTKNVFVKIKNFVFLPKYARCGKNVEKQNFLFQRDLQIDRIRSFRFNCKKRYKNEKFYFKPNLCEIRNEF